MQVNGAAHTWDPLAQLQVGCVLTDMAGVAHAEQARWML